LQKIKDFLKKNWVLLLIIVVAAGLRLYKLDVLPPGLYPDEAANGQDVIRMLEEGDHQVIYGTNGPREALFIYLQGFFVWLGKTFDIAALKFTALSLRLAPAIIGTVTVWAVYLFGKELSNKREVGLLAAATMAVSSWHIQFSRNGFRAIMLPLILCFVFYFFIRAYREGKLKDYLWFGAFLGLGFYTYLSIRMLPLVFMAFILWTWLFDKKFLKENYKKVLWALGAFGVVMIPMLIHFVHVPADIFGRASTSIFNPELNNGSAIKTLLLNIKKELLMFNFAGDENFRHNLGGSPMLELATGIFMWVGAAISVIKIKKVEHFLLLALFGAMSVPMVITAEGIPHALRLVGTLPVIFVWIGLGMSFILDKIKNPKFRYVLATTIILIAAFFGAKKYFVDFPSHAEAREAYTEDMVYMAENLNNLSAVDMNYLITGEFGLKTVYFLTHEKNPPITQLETYEIENEFRPTSQSFRVYVTPSWLPEARKSLIHLKYQLDFTPVKSRVDGRTLYYVGKN